MKNAGRGMMLRLLLYGAVIAVFVLVPVSFFESHPLCPIYHLWGVRCPTCGMTRAFSSLFHLDFAGAVGHNPLALLLFPLFWAFVLSDLRVWLKRRRGGEGRSLFEILFEKVFPAAPEK